MMKQFSLIALATGLLAAAPAAALSTFATFTPTNSTTNMSYQNGTLITNSNGSTSADGINVLFSFLLGNDPALLGINSTFTSTSAIAQDILPATGSFDLGSAVGSFSFISNEAITIGGNMLATGSNLLSGTYASGFLSGSIDGTAGNLRGSTGSGSVINFTSDFLNFAPGSEFDFSIALTSVAAPFGQGGGTLANFDASAGGLFSAEPLPTIAVGAVPEPATWAMLILGFGMVGVSVRNRRRIGTVVLN